MLRWRNPAEPIPMLLRSSLWWSGKHKEIFLDGKETQHASKIPVTLGKHALTLTVEDFDPAYAIILMTGRLNEDYVRLLPLEGDTFFCSVPDATWRYSLKPPVGDAWQLPDFDDSAWLPMVEKPFPPRSEKYTSGLDEWTNGLIEEGAVGLGIDTSPSFMQQIKALLGKQSTLPRIYIRKTFIVRQGRQKEEEP